MSQNSEIKVQIATTSSKSGRSDTNNIINVKLSNELKKTTLYANQWEDHQYYITNPSQLQNAYADHGHLLSKYLNKKGLSKSRDKKNFEPVKQTEHKFSYGRYSDAGETMNINKSGGFIIQSPKASKFKVKLRKSGMDPWDESLKDEHYTTLGPESSNGFKKIGEKVYQNSPPRKQSTIVSQSVTKLNLQNIELNGQYIYNKKPSNNLQKFERFMKLQRKQSDIARSESDEYLPLTDSQELRLQVTQMQMPSKQTRNVIVIPGNSEEQLFASNNSVEVMKPSKFLPMVKVKSRKKSTESVTKTRKKDTESVTKNTEFATKKQTKYEVQIAYFNNQDIKSQIKSSPSHPFFLKRHDRQKSVLETKNQNVTLDTQQGFDENVTRKSSCSSFKFRKSKNEYCNSIVELQRAYRNRKTNLITKQSNFSKQQIRKQNPVSKGFQITNKPILKLMDDEQTFLRKTSINITHVGSQILPTGNSHSNRYDEDITQDLMN